MTKSIKFDKFSKQPVIGIVKYPVNSLVLFAIDNQQKKTIELIHYFIVKRNYLAELCENLLLHPTVQFIYIEENSNEYKKILEKINSKIGAENYILRKYLRL